MKDKVFVKLNVLTRKLQNSAVNPEEEEVTGIKDGQTYSNKIKIRTA